MTMDLPRRNSSRRNRLHHPRHRLSLQRQRKSPLSLRRRCRKKLFRTLSNLRMMMRRKRMRSLCRLFRDRRWENQVLSFIPNVFQRGCSLLKVRLLFLRALAKMAQLFVSRCNEVRETLCGIFRSADWSKSGGSLSLQRINMVSRWNLIGSVMLNIDAEPKYN